MYGDALNANLQALGESNMGFLNPMCTSTATSPDKEHVLSHNDLIRVAEKNILLCLSRSMKYISRYTPGECFHKFSTHKRIQHVRACRRFNRSPLDEPAVHIKQESQSPEGGKHPRLIKRELPDGPMEQETEEDQTDEREYSESHGHDSGQDEDIAEDLSMAPDIMIPEDQVEA
ncbi:hypothetical protein ALC62_02027 [Cyphomyrmex costatus]|uniref:Uncharacterized protein n=1 Tax=Cyphomyrmex costatus TaxID=456900 RepID=A0A151INF7_9HYME|nr:hypothetical protein ALC62_02027 [Cyphomyrmex costatus]